MGKCRLGKKESCPPEGKLPESFGFKPNREPMSWRWESREGNTVTFVVPFLTYLCMRVWVCMLWACVEFRGQPLGIGFLLRSGVLRGLDSGCRVGGKCPYSLSHFASPFLCCRGQRKRSHAHWPPVWKGKSRF